jgi:hypothetical protein
MTKALELAKFGRETPPTGVVVGDSDTQILSSKTFSDGPVFSGGTANGVPYLNGSKVFTTGSALVFDGTNLGVGISSPAAKLHVNVAGDNETTIARFGTTSSGSVVSQLKILSDPTAGVVKFDATGSTSQGYLFLTGGTERVRFDTSGNVLIGTATATGNNDRLYAIGTSNNVATFKGTAGLACINVWNDANKGPGLGVYNSTYSGGSNLGVGANGSYLMTSTGAPFGIGTIDSQVLILGTGNTERLRIDATGRLLVGSTSGRGGNTSQHIFRIPTGSSYFEIQQQSTSGTTDVLFTDGATGSYGIVGYDHSVDALRIFTNSAERLRIDSSGNLGIGTSNPFYQVMILRRAGSTITAPLLNLQSQTSGSTDGDSFILYGTQAANWAAGVDQADSNKFRIEPSTTLGAQTGLTITTAGNFGIGTTSPAAKLTVAGSSLFNGTGLGLGEVTPSYGGISFGFDGGPNLAQIIAVNASTSSLGFYTKAQGAAPSERMRIDAAGKVGIGTTSPSTTLTVVGDVRVEHSGTGSFGLQAVGGAGAARDIFLAGQSGYSNGFTVRYNGTNMGYTFQDGNVGINTTDPKNPLHVVDSRNYTYSSTVDHTTNMSGIRVTNTNNGDNWAGVWFGIGSAQGTHWSGISGARTNNAANWGTHLAFYTHEDATSNLTQATERMRIDSKGLVSQINSNLWYGFKTRLYRYSFSGSGSSSMVTYNIGTLINYDATYGTATVKIRAPLVYATAGSNLGYWEGQATIRRSNSGTSWTVLNSTIHSVDGANGVSDPVVYWSGDTCYIDAPVYVGFNAEVEVIVWAGEFTANNY